MSYKVRFGRAFQGNRRKLAKRFRNIERDIELAIGLLQKTPEIGLQMPGNSGIRKLRVQNSDMPKGKSGGYRLLYYVADAPEKAIYLLAIYAKSDTENLSQHELQELVRELQAYLSGEDL